MHVLEIRISQTRGKLEVSDKPCRSQFETGLACVEWRFWSGAQTSQGGAVKLRGDWGGSSVAAHSRALLRLCYSVVCPTKPPSGYAGLNWLGELVPCASHRIVILCLLSQVLLEALSATNFAWKVCL